MTEPRVERTRGVGWAAAVAMSLAGAGLAVGSQLLVVAATLPLWYVAVAALGTDPGATVRITRDVAGVEPDAIEAGDPGDTVRVRTTVGNVGSVPAVDLRVADAVPDALPVVDGSPRASVTLDPGEEATVEYAVELRRGEHAFGEPTVRTRDLTGTVAETWSASVVGDDRLTCSPTVEDVPLGEGTNDYAGEVPTDEGGSGVEFYSVREYEPGDPVSAIDWRRYAGSRDLATVEYRAERATRVVCVVDARASQLRGPTRTSLPAVQLSADAAERTLDTLVDGGYPTGVVGLYGTRVTAVPPGTDAATRHAADDLLDAARDSDVGVGNYARRRTDDPVTELVGTLPGEAQVLLFSSFVDDLPVELVEHLRAHGYPVRVVSPAVAAADDDGSRLARLDRQGRLAAARASGARVVDWPQDRPLGLVLRDAVGEVRSR